MRPIFLSLLLPLGAATSLSSIEPAQAQSTSAAPTTKAGAWKSFSPRNAGFVVSMPGVPKSERKESKDKDGTRTLDQDYTLDAPNLMMMVGYQQYEARAARLVDKNTLLDEVAQEIVRGLGAQVRSRKKIAQNGFPAREVAAVVEGAVVRMRVMWAGRRLYLAMVVHPGSGQEARDANRFLSSLRLLKAQP